MQISRQHKWVLVIIILLFLGITTCQNLDQSKHSLSYSSYQIPSDKIDTPIRILQLTDLHNSEFGEDNQELIDRIASQSPDLILLTGDLLNSGEPVTEIATNLISSLCEIAPVYLSLGNHEIWLGIFSHNSNSPFNQTRRRLGGRQPLCGMGVTSRIIVTSRPVACRARMALSRPEPGPLT